MRFRFLRPVLLALLMLAPGPIRGSILAGAASPVCSASCDPANAGNSTGCCAFISREGGRWEADNEAQAIRLSLSGDGVRIVPIPPDTSSWEWGLSLLRHGWDGDLRGSGEPILAAAGDRVDLLRGSLREWYRNGPNGIEHGLEIAGGPDGALGFPFEYLLEGDLTPKVSEDGRTVVFRDRSGRAALSCLDLRGEDATGREVTARWEWVEHPEDSRPILRLMLRGAAPAYPLRVLERLAAPKGSSGKVGTVRPVVEAGVAVSPANDLCSGAEVIPGAGPFPHLSSVVDLTDATIAGDPPIPSCQSSLSRSIWFAFTPAESASYSFSVCSEAPSATTLEDTILAVYAASGSCSGLSEVVGGCSDDACGPTGLQSSIDRLPLSAGTTYYIVAWSYGTAAPPPGAESLQLLVTRSSPPGPAPPNDTCAGAEVIPGTGPFPFLTTVTADIGGATTNGDPPVPSCQPAVSRSIWYSFTPTETGRYAFSTCADGPTSTTVDDTILAIYSSIGACSGLLEAPGGCDDDSCASEAAQSVLSGVTLAAGTTYYLVVWQYGTTAPAPGNTAVQVRVGRIAAPPNDTCAAAAPLPLDTPVTGTTVSAYDDTRIPTGSACFSGIGQTPSTATGNDVVYRFTAADAGRYSFRLAGYDPSKNAVLYVASDCPGGAPPAPAGQCLGAANRTSNAPEEVICLSLGAGQSVYVYVDEVAPTAGSAFTLEANRCALETEPNGTPATAGEAVCGVEGSIAPAGDADTFALGIPEADSRVFALADGVAAASTDFDLRVTTAADTLEYDDFNNDTPFGSASPNVEGTRLTGSAAYLRVSHYSSAAQAEPYRLYASVRPPASSATPEVEPNDTLATATAGASEYFSGTISGAGDLDFFSFSAVAGEVIQIGLDLDPARDNTPFNGSLALVDASGATLLLVNDPSSISSNAAGTGSLTASTPYSPGEGMAYRVRADGSYYVKVAGSSGTPGDYLISIAHNCRIAPPTDLAVNQTDAPDPVPPGGTVTYSILVQNLGAHTASVVTLRDELPSGASLVSASSSQGICVGSGPVVCHLGNLEAGASATVSIQVAAPAAPGSLTNTARVSTVVMDASPDNDLAAETTTVGLADSDGDGFPDASDCAPADPDVWADPGEAIGLHFSAVDTTLLQWSPPPAPGGTMVLFDLLRSPTAGGFQAPACLATGISGTSATDAALPGAVFYYLVRSENICSGNLGTRSDGTPRTAGTCP